MQLFLRTLFIMNNNIHNIIQKANILIKQACILAPLGYSVLV